MLFRSYSCGAFGDDRQFPIDFKTEISGQKIFPIRYVPELQTMNGEGCYTCPMFEICNGCKKTIKDMKLHNMVEEHCSHMKQLAPRIIKINDEVDYVDAKRN